MRMRRDDIYDDYQPLKVQCGILDLFKVFARVFGNAILFVFVLMVGYKGEAL